MASSVTNNQGMSTTLKIVGVLSGNVTTAAAVPVDKDNGSTWFDMKDAEKVIIMANLVALGGNGIEAFSIVADQDSDGGNSNVTLVAHSDPTTADAAGDYVMLEIDVKQLAEESSSTSGELRYIAAKLECHHSSDNVWVQLIAQTNNPKKDKTADYAA